MLLVWATRVVAAVLVLAFAAGWLSPGRLGPADIVDSLQIHDGVHPGFRRAHAKGLCIEGMFLATSMEMLHAARRSSDESAQEAEHYRVASGRNEARLQAILEAGDVRALRRAGRRLAELL